MPAAAMVIANQNGAPVRKHRHQDAAEAAQCAWHIERAGEKRCRALEQDVGPVILEPLLGGRSGPRRRGHVPFAATAPTPDAAVVGRVGSATCIWPLEAFRAVLWEVWKVWTMRVCAACVMGTSARLHQGRVPNSVPACNGWRDRRVLEYGRGRERGRCARTQRARAEERTLPLPTRTTCGARALADLPAHRTQLTLHSFVRRQ